MASAHVITEESLSHIKADVHNCCSLITSTATLISIHILKELSLSNREDGNTLNDSIIRNSCCSVEDIPKKNTLSQNSIWEQSPRICTV